MKPADALTPQLAEIPTAILNAMPAHLALLDGSGVIVAVNQAWRSFAAGSAVEPGGSGVGENYLAVCEAGAGEARAVAAGIRRVLAGEQPMFALEYAATTAGEPRWFRLTASLLGEGGGVVVSQEDITERTLAVGELRKRRRLERVRAQEAAVLEAISAGRPLAEVWETMRRGLEEMLGREPGSVRVLKAEGGGIGGEEAMGGEAGWTAPVLDVDGRVLAGLAVAHPPPGPEDQEAIEQATRLVRLALGREEREQALRASEARFRSIFQFVPTSIWEQDWSGVIEMLRPLRAAGVTDWAGYFAAHPEWVKGALRAVRVLDVNEATLRLYGGGEKAELMRSLETRFSPETLPDFVRELVALAEGRSLFEAEMGGRTIGGEPIHVLLTMAFPPLDGGSGKVLVSIADITRRKRAEEQLRLLQTCIARINDIVIITEVSPVDGGGPRVVYVNDAFEERMGYRREVILGKTPRLLRDPETSEESRACVEALARGESVRAEIMNRSRSGEELWSEANIVPVANVAGRYTHWVAIERDITERRRAVALLQASEARFRMLSRATNDAVWDWDLATGTLWWNEGFEALCGLRRPEVEPTMDAWYARLHPEDREPVESSVRRAIEGGAEGWSCAFRIRGGDDSHAYVLARGHVIRDAAGKAVRMIGGMTDLTERKRVEERLAEQAALLDAAHEAILVQDLEERIIYWNKGAERAYGWTAAEALGRHPAELFGVPRENTDAARRRLFEQGEWNGEVPKRTKAGQEIVVEVRWTLVRDAAGQPKSVLAIHTDITERKKLEQQFLRAQRMESIGTLAGGIAHDLNNLLAPITMGVDLLRLDIEDPHCRMVIDNIERSARRGANLVKQVLSFARGVEGTRVPLQLRHILGEMKSIVGNTFPKNIALVSEVPRDLWPVIGDPTQLNQVLLNLCVNARDAMPDGGQLTLRAANVVVDEQYAVMNRGVAAGRYVAVEVIDNGCGIPRELHDRIFEPFFTTKEVGKGTGLGLSTVLGIVRSHGGFVNVSSEPGKGSVFKLHLPAQPAAVTGGSASPFPSELPRGNGELILVVDDEGSIREITRQTLEAFGYRVVTAEDGAQAIALYAQHQREVALVLTDMMMPVMDGPALIAALHRMDPRLGVIAASGLNGGGNVATAASAGVREFLPKPYSADTMLTTIRRVLTENAARGGQS